MLLFNLCGDDCRMGRKAVMRWTVQSAQEGCPTASLFQPRKLFQNRSDQPVRFVLLGANGVCLVRIDRTAGVHCLRHLIDVVGDVAQQFSHPVSSGISKLIT